MLTALLVFASLIIGSCWGIIIAIFKMVRPLQKTLREERERTIKFLDEQVEHLRAILRTVPGSEKDGSVLSPIQIKPNE